VAKAPWLGPSWVAKLYDPRGALASYRERTTRLQRREAPSVGFVTPDARRWGRRLAEAERVSSRSLRARTAACNLALWGTFSVFATLLLAALAPAARAHLEGDARLAGIVAVLLVMPWGASVLLHMFANVQDARFERDCADWGLPDG
jgi:hypothetical protein